ncbi:MAG: hypothetical protein H7175_13275 [Burkholderiales bacterium]|nr:hypothetical protein [Anaerolineae bacterium]
MLCWCRSEFCVFVDINRVFRVPAVSAAAVLNELAVTKADVGVSRVSALAVSFLL